TGTAELTADISDQSDGLPVISGAASDRKYTSDVTGYSARLLNKCALVKFDVQNYDGEGMVSITGMNNKVTVDLGGRSFSYIADETNNGKITLNHKSGSEYWAILLPQGAVSGGTASFSGGWSGEFGEVPEIECNAFLTNAIKVNLTSAVTTGDVENITAESADVKYSIEPNAVSQATEHGVVYSTSENPDLDHGTVVPYTAPCKGENYTVALTGLTANTKYYARAYAKYAPAKDGNEVIVYGEQKDFTTQTIAPTAPVGALPRLFTVSAGEDMEDGTEDDVKVWFSQGNLQYVKSSSTWQFAANQYETVESDGQDVGEDYEYQDIVGLFGWGTSGWNNGNIYYQPYNTHYMGDYEYEEDEEEIDPEDPGNPYQNVGLGYGPIKDGHGGFNLTNNYEYEFAEADWGVHNAIANGGNEAGIWRTLSGDEWYYLCDIDGDHEARRGKYKKNVMVNGVRGFLIAPDDWNLENYPLQSEYNGTSDPLTWEAAEDAGLVFLPAAGQRGVGNYVWSVNEIGLYWSSSTAGDERDSRRARNLFFYDTGSTGVGDMFGFNGAAVRLVSDCTDAR
ncbi:MAG: hypothetical protein MJ000_01855, partial [Bacteroidales bacterium]|nr:hypothetical protein [Bacteroidales bacterium]